MDQFYESANANPLPPGCRLGGRFTAKLFVAFVVSLILIALPRFVHFRAEDESRHVAAKAEPLTSAKKVNVSPEEEAVVSPAETALQPVLAAIETYHRQ
jgi:hypothetical protein